MNMKKKIVRPLLEAAKADVATLTEEECYDELDQVTAKLNKLLPHGHSDKLHARQVALQQRLRSIT